jgi:hypothetical protein
MKYFILSIFCFFFIFTSISSFATNYRSDLSPTYKTTLAWTHGACTGMWTDKFYRC